MSAGWKELSIREVIYSMRNGSCQMIFYLIVVILKSEAYGKVGCGCVHYSIENLVLPPGRRQGQVRVLWLCNQGV